ncbi:MAG: fibronectin type III domain-containing protein, partial [Planctomycetota bacterium]
RDVSPAQNETAASTAESATTEDVPAQVGIIGSWIEGTSHTAEAGSARALIFTTHAEDDNTDMNASVTYGGQAMTKVIEQNEGTGYRAYVGAFILDEAGIAAASGSTFNVSWAQSPSRTPGYSSVFLEGVDQADLIGASAGNSNTSSPISTSALATSDGDMVVVAGSVGATGTYTCDNGFTEALEITVESGDGVAGYKAATGASETPQLTHSAVNRQVIVGFVVQAGATGPDTDPPTPNPATFASAPAAISDTAISMTATTGSDTSGPVQYFFDETSGNSGGTDSGWQTSTNYTDTGLTASTQYTYTVQMRDSIPNTGTASSPANATTQAAPDTTPPTPDPATWSSVPSAGSDTIISMTATTASDVSGVEYYFMETSANPGATDSGWQDPASYTDTGLTGSTQYCYEVQARDKSVNQNATAWSTNQCATTQSTPDTTAPTPDPMTWNSAPAAGGTDNISMTASTASDPSGVEYNFDETSGNPGGTDSGWQDSINYTDSGLNDSTQYCYRVQARDKSVNQNATAYSSTQCATTDAISDTDPPTPNPATWAAVPAADGSNAIDMNATTGSDPSGVEYSFDETSVKLRLHRLRSQCRHAVLLSCANERPERKPEHWFLVYHRMCHNRSSRRLDADSIR